MTTGSGTPSLTNHHTKTGYIWPREAIGFINSSRPCSTITYFSELSSTRNEEQGPPAKSESRVELDLGWN